MNNFGAQNMVSPLKKVLMKKPQRFMSKVNKKKWNYTSPLDQNLINEIHSVDGIGISQIHSLKKFFLNKQNLMLVSNLINLLDIKNYKFLIKKTPLSGKLIMFTGAFENNSRSELKVIAENLGAKILSNISKKTDFLIVGSQKPTTRKINEAKNLNVKMLTEKDWNNIINK